MDPFLAFKIGATGLRIQRLRMDIISSNLANIDTTRTPQGGPYRRKDLVVAAVPVLRPVQTGEFGDILQAKLSQSLKAAVPVAVVSDPRPFKVVYDPSHPDADKNGYVRLPNINPIEEMVNMISALRAYEANVAAINNAKAMIQKAIEIGR